MLLKKEASGEVSAKLADLGLVVVRIESSAGVAHASCYGGLPSAHSVLQRPAGTQVRVLLVGALL